MVTEWQSRPLEPLYCIIWMDPKYYNVKQDHKIVNRCEFNIFRIFTSGCFIIQCSASSPVRSKILPIIRRNPSSLSQKLFSLSSIHFLLRLFAIMCINFFFVNFNVHVSKYNILHHFCRPCNQSQTNFNNFYTPD